MLKNKKQKKKIEKKKEKKKTKPQQPNKRDTQPHAKDRVQTGKLQ